MISRRVSSITTCMKIDLPTKTFLLVLSKQFEVRSRVTVFQIKN